MTPLVSIILPVRNGEVGIELAVKSILQQTFPRFELLILDDGSTDNTISIINEFSDSRIRLLSDGEPKGITARLNQGIAEAKGELIARMDADDIAYPDRLQKQVDFLLANPSVDLSGTSMLVFNKNFEVVGKRVVPNSHEVITSNPMRGFPLMHPTFMGRAAWFRKNNYAVCLGSEDQDLLLRTFKKSNFSNLPEILFAYRENEIEPLKYANGRRSYLQSLIREGYANRTSKKLLMKLFNKIKYARDFIGRISGLEYKLLSNRAQPADAKEVDYFEKLLLLLKSSQKEVSKA